MNVGLILPLFIVWAILTVMVFITGGQGIKNALQDLFLLLKIVLIIAFIPFIFFVRKMEQKVKGRIVKKIAGGCLFFGTTLVIFFIAQNFFGAVGSSLIAMTLANHSSRLYQEPALAS